jgi:hypothetical protein
LKAASFPATWSRTYQKEVYYGHYTLNDNTHRDCVMTLLDAAKRLGKPEYRAAALRGGDFLIAAQLPEPQPAWAQQYNPQMEPAWARAFEPPSVCSNEGAAAMRLLVDLYIETGEKKFLEPLPRAIAWYRRSEIAPGVWARMYELGTNKPIFGDRDGKVHYTVEELSPERQTGYSWKGAYGVPMAISYYEEVMRAGRESILEKRKAAATPTEKQRVSRAKGMESRVRAVIASLDGQGRWIGGGKGGEGIRTDLFAANVRLLCDYLEVVK